jgi:hypothetical protein
MRVEKGVVCRQRGLARGLGGRGGGGVWSGGGGSSVLCAQERNPELHPNP